MPVRATKLYKIDNNNNNNRESDLLSLIVGIFVYAFVLIIVSRLFRNFEIANFSYAIIAALILSFLNYTIKPLLIYWTLPLNIITLGLTYPIVNMIILKLCDILMGNYFNIRGFWSLFFITIFISLFKIFFDSLITKRVGGR